MNFIKTLGFDDWWPELKQYALDKKNFTKWQDFANPEDFPKLLTDFLFSSYGSKFKQNFKFAGDLICNNDAPMIMVRIEANLFLIIS